MALMGKCPRCDKPGPHFVPPSFGQIGFYSCDVPDDLRNHTRCRPPFDHEHPDHVPDLMAALEKSLEPIKDRGRKEV